MEMAYRERWQAEIAELQKILSGFDLSEECKWGKPCYTLDGKNIVIIQGFKEYCALGFFQGALLKDPKKLLVQLGQVQAQEIAQIDVPERLGTLAGDHLHHLLWRDAVGAQRRDERPRGGADVDVELVDGAVSREQVERA